MKTLKTIKTLALLAGVCVAVSVAAGCENDKGVEGNPLLPQELIVGRWKLVEVSIRKNYQAFKTYDYSKNRIIYDFRENNKLVVIGSIIDDLSIFENFQAGEHFYEYHTPIEGPLVLPGPNLLIDNLERYFCTIHLEGGTTVIVGDKYIGGEIDEKGLQTGGDYISWGMYLIRLKN